MKESNLGIQECTLLGLYGAGNLPRTSNRMEIYVYPTFARNITNTFSRNACYSWLHKRSGLTNETMRPQHARAISRNTRAIPRNTRAIHKSMCLLCSNKLFTRENLRNAHSSHRKSSRAEKRHAQKKTYKPMVQVNPKNNGKRACSGSEEPWAKKRLTFQVGRIEFTPRD